MGAVTRKQGFSRLVSAYWRPIYVYLRLRHHCTDSDAHDLTQSFFAQWWERSLLTQALVDLRASYTSQSRDLDLALFDEYELASAERPGYAELAVRHGVPVTTVTNRLASVRRALRAGLAECLRELTATEEEYRDESYRIFGVRPK